MSTFAVECPDGFTPSFQSGDLVCSDGGSTAEPGFQVLDLAVIATNSESGIDPGAATSAVAGGLSVGVALFGVVFAIRIIIKMVLSAN